MNNGSTEMPDDAQDRMEIARLEVSAALLRVQQEANREIRVPKALNELQQNLVYQKSDQKTQ
jgi:hypothetical protein